MEPLQPGDAALPLTALRAFESAARLMSFTRAAEELRVTAGAISHQIKSLETELGMPLFRRSSRTVSLTEAGQLLLPEVRDGFSRLSGAVRRARRLGKSGPLTISAAPSIVAKWLVNRLDRFYADHPGIDLHIDTSGHLVDFSREEVDMAIRYGGGQYSGVHVEPLLRNRAFPVCSPALLQGAHPLRTAADLKHHTLLHDLNGGDERGHPQWARWLATAGVTDIDTSHGLYFNATYLALEMAAAGKGVALGVTALVAEDLAAGRLVQPFSLSVPVDFAYYIVCPWSAMTQQKIKIFRDWLVAEASASTVEERVLQAAG